MVKTFDESSQMEISQKRGTSGIRLLESDLNWIQNDFVLHPIGTLRKLLHMLCIIVLSIG